jgi:acyl carrier protein
MVGGERHAICCGRVSRVKHAPALDDLAEKIRELLTRIVDPAVRLELDTALMKDLGLDSLDMIETSFALEEFFGFEFSGRNAVEELDRRIGDGRILSAGALTALGREALFERMPELRAVTLPATLRAAEIPQYFTIRTYARVIKDFYDHAPDICPETGEPVVLDGFAMVSERSRRPVPAPSGDDLLEAWLEAKARELQQP